MFGTKRTGAGTVVSGGVAMVFAALLGIACTGSVALAEDAYTITYDAGTFGMLPGVADDDGLPARTLVQTKQRGQSATLFPNAPEANVAYFVLDWQATVSANGGTFDDGSSERQLSGQIGNRSPEFAHWNGSDGKAYYPGDAYSADSDLALSAKWNIYPHMDVDVPALPIAKRAGYRLTGYYTQAEGGEFVANAGVIPPKDAEGTLYAHWAPDSSEGVSSFWDVSSSTSHAGDVKHICDLGLTTGYPDGTFRPYETIKRCDMAAFLFRLAVRWGAASESWQPSVADRLRFSDVMERTPHAREIRWLGSTGISGGWQVGSGTEFRPYADVTRQDMAAFLFRLARVAKRGWAGSAYEPSYAVRGKFVDLDFSRADNHHDEVMWLAERKISEGFPVSSSSSGRYPKARFAGMAPIARCDMAAFLTRMGNLPSSEEW